MPSEPNAASYAPDLILFGSKFKTLDRENSTATVVAIKGGAFAAVGQEDGAMVLVGASTTRVDLKGRRVLPGLIDNHLHIIHGGLNYNMELRWDGIRPLADAMAMLQEAILAAALHEATRGLSTVHAHLRHRTRRGVNRLNCLLPAQRGRRRVRPAAPWPNRGPCQTSAWPRFSAA